MKNKQRGLTLLIAIVTTSVLLLISFVVVNVSLKQILLASSSQQSQYAFFNADSGLECAIYWDLKFSYSYFATSTPNIISCNGQTISTGSQTVPTIPPQSSLIGGGGAGNPDSIFSITLPKGCAIVIVKKNSNGNTTIDSKGYNNCSSSAQRRLERGITITYASNTNPPPSTILRVKSNVGSGNWVVSGGLGAGSGSSYVSYAATPGLAYTVDPGYISTGYDEPPVINVPALSIGETRNVDITYTPTAPPSITASGGTVVDSGGYRIHTFTSSGTLTVTVGGIMEYLVVGGGGGGGVGDNGGAGGGAGGGGGFVTGSTNVSNGSYAVTVGDGGSGAVSGCTNGSNGNNSLFGAFATANGGGGGALGACGGGNPGQNGGSGGGGARGGLGGSSTGGGNAGGRSTVVSAEARAGGGGGGAGAVGGASSGASSWGPAGNGGNGLSSSISGAAVIYAGGGGGGGGDSANRGSGGSGGGGAGGNPNGGNGTNGLGGGGGGGSGNSGVVSAGGNGGKGIVIIRYTYP